MEREPAATAPSFCSVLLGNFSETLRIPSSFIKHIKGRSSKSFILKCPVGRHWCVEVKKVGKHLFFGNGWKVFVKDLTLENGDFLVFVYHYNLEFGVEVFDKSGCEKKKNSTGKSHDKEVIYKGQVETQNSRECFIGCRLIKERKPNISGKTNGGSIFSESRPWAINGGRMFEAPYSVEQYNGLVRTESPSFCMVMLGDFSKDLRIPPAFIMHIKGSSTGKFILESHEKGLWHVEVKKNGNDLFFQNGWPSFVEHNSLRTGDFLVFTYHGCSKFLVEIFDKNGCEKDEALADEKCGKSSEKREIPKESEGLIKCKTRQNGRSFVYAEMNRSKLGVMIERESLLTESGFFNPYHMLLSTATLKVCGEHFVEVPGISPPHKAHHALTKLVEGKCLQPIRMNRQKRKGEELSFQSESSSLEGDRLPKCKRLLPAQSNDALPSPQQFFHKFVQSDKVEVSSFLRRVESSNAVKNRDEISVNSGDLNVDHSYSHLHKVSSSSIEIIEDDKKQLTKKEHVLRRPLCTKFKLTRCWSQEFLREVELYSTETNGRGNSVNDGNLTGSQNYSDPGEVSSSSLEIVENDSKQPVKKHVLRRSTRIKSIQTDEKDKRELKYACSSYSAFPRKTHDTATSSMPGEQVYTSKMDCSLEQENSVNMDEPSFVGEKGENVFDKEEPLTYYLTFVSKRRFVTNEEKGKAFQAAIAFRPINPFFTVVMRPTHVYRGFFMTVPHSFFKTYIRRAADVILEVSDQKRWLLKLICKGVGVGLSKGWSAFVWENNLEEGDVCIFELVNSNEITFRVTIIRVVEELVPLCRVRKSR